MSHRTAILLPLVVAICVKINKIVENKNSIVYFLSIDELHNEIFLFTKTLEMLYKDRCRYAEYFWCKNYHEIPSRFRKSCVVKVPAKIAAIIDLPQ